ncbi:hypothetical protein ACFSNO_19115, partial [Streptomyces cirratus]
MARAAGGRTGRGERGVGGAGRPLGEFPQWVPGWVAGGVRRVIARPRYELALRSGAAGALVLVGGGVLLVGASLVWHGAEVRGSFLG